LGLFDLDSDIIKFTLRRRGMGVTDKPYRPYR
jgi:hypothetical protein